MKSQQVLGLLIAGLIAASVHLATLKSSLDPDSSMPSYEPVPAPWDEEDLPLVEYAPPREQIDQGILIEDEELAVLELAAPEEEVPRFRIIHCHTGLPLEAFEHATLFLSNGSNKFLRLGSSEADSVAQEFHLDEQRNPHGFELINEKFDRTVVIPQRSTIPGDRLMLSLSDDITAWADRAFQLAEDLESECFEIRNVFSNMCLQPVMLQSYADIIQEVCTGDRSQQFMFQRI
jgi:hypothetical protein